MQRQRICVLLVSFLFVGLWQSIMFVTTQTEDDGSVQPKVLIGWPLPAWTATVNLQTLVEAGWIETISKSSRIEINWGFALVDLFVFLGFVRVIFEALLWGLATVLRKLSLATFLGIVGFLGFHFWSSREFFLLRDMEIEIVLRAYALKLESIFIFCCWLVVPNWIFNKLSTLGAARVDVLRARISDVDKQE